MSSNILQPLVMIGAGGHAVVLAEILRQLDRPLIAVVSDIKPEAAVFEGVLHYENDNTFLANYKPTEITLINGIGQLPGNATRKKIAQFYLDAGYEFASVVAPSAIVSPSAHIELGCQILDGVIIHGESYIGAHSIVNTSAIVEHHCCIGEYCHIAPRSVLCGGVQVASDTHIGVGATLIQQINVAQGCMIGAGAVITENVPANQKVYGARSIIKSGTL